MSNQYNYRETLEASLSSRYTISRFTSFPTEGVVNTIIPADFGFYQNEYAELILYNSSDGSFIQSQKIVLSDNIINVHEVSYSDGTSQNYITVDFTQFNILYPNFLIPGVFDLVLNFFEDMIGSEANKKLSIKTISDSRKELNLQFNTPFTANEEDELTEIVVKSIPRPFLGGITDIITAYDNITDTGISTAEIYGPLAANNPKEFSVLGNLSLQANYDKVIQDILTDARNSIIFTIQTENYRLRQPNYESIVTAAITTSFLKFQKTFDDRTNVV